MTSPANYAAKAREIAPCICAQRTLTDNAQLHTVTHAIYCGARHWPKIEAALLAADAAGYQRGREEAAKIVEPWLSAGHIRLMAGELGSAKVRAVKAVVLTILQQISRGAAPDQEDRT